MCQRARTRVCVLMGGICAYGCGCACHVCDCGGVWWYVTGAGVAVGISQKPAHVYSMRTACVQPCARNQRDPRPLTSRCRRRSHQLPSWPPAAGRSSRSHRCQSACLHQGSKFSVSMPVSISISMSAPGNGPSSVCNEWGGAGATRLEAARGGKPWLHASALCSLGSFGTSSRRQVDNGSAPNGARRLLQLRRMPP